MLLKQHLTQGLQQQTKAQEALAHEVHLRFFVSCWCAYAAYKKHKSTKERGDLLPQNNEKEEEDDDWFANMSDHALAEQDLEAQMDNFYRLLQHQVRDPDAWTLPTQELRQTVQSLLHSFAHHDEWELAWQQERTNLTVAYLADLQIVVPRFWIGSRLTLDHDYLLQERQITHQIYVSAAPPPSAALERFDYVWSDPLIQSTTPTQHTVTLVELPRHEWQRRQYEPQFHGFRSSTSIQNRPNPFELTSAFLSQLYDQDHQTQVLVYCDNGTSVSIAVCCGWLMHQFALSLCDAMQLIQSARRFVGVSKDLMHQLELFERQLHTARQTNPLQHAQNDKK